MDVESGCSRDKQCAIFLVGTSRSGTALVQSILNNTDVQLTGETHYFDDLRVKMGPACKMPLNTEERQRCENYFLALAHRPYGHGGDPAKGWMNREELRAFAQELGPGSDAYFEAFCRLEANRREKIRWGEKTPRHVFRLKELLTLYPSGQVICMVRDPRAVVASYRDWRNQGGFDFEVDPGHAETLQKDEIRSSRSYHILIASILWRSTISAATRARQQFGEDRVFIQRYEDLVLEPEVATKRLVEWLNLEYHPALLNVPLHNSSVFKFDAHRGVTQNAIDTWRTRLSNAEIGVIETCCGSVLRDMGYERVTKRPMLGPLVAAWFTLPFAAIRAAKANRSRIGNLMSYVYVRLRLALLSGHSR